MSLEEKLSNLPTQPGCYLFRDKKAKIIYVGKAKNLRNRVRQYFHSDRANEFKTGDLIARIHDVDLIVYYGELPALERATDSGTSSMTAGGIVKSWRLMYSR